MLLEFRLPAKFSPTTKKDAPSADGSLKELTDFQKCREINLFCQSCFKKWEAAVPRTFSVYRYPCPHCKCDTHGNVLAVLER